MHSSKGIEQRLRDSLRGVDSDSIVVIGGSSLTNWATPTSDLDLLVVGSKEVSNQALKSITWPRPVDLEFKSRAWLEDFCVHLHTFCPKATGGPSPFNFFDLRFAARLVLGTPVLGSPPQELAELIRIALADYFATWWGATYQDVLGLYLSNRADEALVLVGELAQRACMVALLQLELTDPAPKWALTRCLAHERLQVAARRLQRSLKCCSKTDKRWLSEVLRSTNHVIASSKCSLRSKSMGEAPRMQYCVLGRPGKNLLLDAQSGELLIHNDALLESYAQ